ncbi:MAG: DUF1786 family protein [Syntrophobacter sp.]
MSTFLLMDVGAGTLDVLFYDGDSGVHYKAVVKSPVPSLAERAISIHGDILITGMEMGGGAFLDIFSRRALTSEVVITASAAMTLSHNPARLASSGIKVIDDAEAESYMQLGKYTQLVLSDLPLDHLRNIVTSFGVPFEFDVVGACAQDHGMPPRGESHLDYRHKILKAALEDAPFPESVLFEANAVPGTLNRLCSLAQCASAFPAGEAYIMDSGMAAILGASMDLSLIGKQKHLVLDIATSHTVCAAMDGKEIAGFFEYHTRDITLEKLESLLVELAEGHLRHDRVLAEGGHGAYIRKAIGYAAVESIVATGPKRRLVETSRLPITFGAPLGDNMMTGTLGLLEAIRRRRGLSFRSYM